jgi:ribonuclease R
VRGAGGRLGRPYSRENLQKALRHFRGTPDETAINIAFLQSMKQARYSETCRPHWALAFNDYCHFTSPIRRYPDLIVHRALDGAFEPGKPALVKSRSELSQGGSFIRRERLHRLAHLAETCSTTERRAEKAERQLTGFCEMLLMSSRIGDIRKGIVTGVERYGILVDIEGLSSRGFVHVSELPGSGYKFSPKRSALVESRKGGRTFAFGQEVRVRITQVDLVGRRLVLSLVE